METKPWPPRAALLQAAAASLASKLVGLNEPTIEELVRVPSDKRIRIERKLAERATEMLGGDQVLRVFRGQTLVSPVFVPIVGQLLFMAKPRAVIVTEHSMITVQQSMWSQSTIVRVISRHERGGVPVELTSWGLRIGREEKIYASLSTLEDMKEVARLAAEG